MAKRKSRTHKAHVVRAAGRRGRFIAVSVLLSLIIAGAAFARWRSLSATGHRRSPGELSAPSANPMPTAFDPATPSKELIYSGGRLIATEEPAGGSSAPTISQLSPASAAQGSSFTLTVTGANLAGATAINFSPASDITVSNLSPSASQVTASIAIAATAGMGARNVSVSVGAQTSNSLPFSITPAGNPTPTITSLSPNTVPVGSTGFTLTVNGANFVSGSVVLVNNSSRTTTFVNANQLTAQLAAADRSTPGGRTITVFNPTPGGGTSNPLTLTVTSGNPIPQIDSISPQSVTAGGATFTMTVTSNNGTFVSGAVVRYDGSNRSTTFVNATTLTAQILSMDITSGQVGNHFITVVNPSPGGGVSNQVLFIVGSAGASGTGLRGEYFNNMTLCGTPALTRTDAQVNFTWVAGSPATQINPDHFSVRWSGQVQAQFSETYTFSVLTDDGVRLWVNNRLLIDKWFDQYIPEWSNTITLAAGQKYDIRMDYYENTAGAEAHLLWSSLSTPKQPIPTSRLYVPTSTPVLYEGMLEQVNCSTIAGWAMNRNQPNTAINVSIYDGTTLLTTIAANQSRPDLIACSGENGLHGFSWAVPQSLKDGNPHTIRVKYGTTAFELVNSPMTLTCSGVTPPPAATSLNAVAVSASQIDLQWVYSGTTQNGFTLQRSIDGAAYSDYQTITGANVRTYSDINLIAGHSYCYKIIAYNVAGPSPEPNPTACATISGSGGGAPAAPSGLTAVFSSSPRQVTLNWTDNSNNETEFQPLRRSKRTSGGTWSAYISLNRLPANTTSYQDRSRLDAGYTYGYVVRAGNGSYSPYSNEAVVQIATGQAATCAEVNSLSGSGGSASYGYAEGLGPAAKWGAPDAGAAGIDPISGLNALFVADAENQVIRQIYLEGPAKGNSLLLAGSGVAGYYDSEDPFAAMFNNPRGIAVVKNTSGVVQSILVADTENSVIRELAPSGGNRWSVRTFSGSVFHWVAEANGDELLDGTADITQFSGPNGIAVGPDGVIYVADTGNAAVRALNSEGHSTTYYRNARRDIFHLAPFQPIGLAISETTGEIYVTDQITNGVAAITGGVYIALAGGEAGFADGVGADAAFDRPQYLTWVDSEAGGSLYIADIGNNCIRLLDLASAEVTTWAGAGTAGYQDGTNCAGVEFDSPTAVIVGPAGELYVIDKGNNTIRELR